MAEISSGALIACMLFALAFHIRYVGLNLSVSSILLGLLFLIYGPAHFYYVHVWGPETGYLESFLAVGRGAPVIPHLQIALATTFAGVCVGILIADAMIAHGRNFRSAIKEWNATPIAASPAEITLLYRAVFWTVILLLLPFAIIDNQLGAAIQYFGSVLAENERLYIRRELGGSSFYLYNLLSNNWAPFLSFCALAAYFAGSRQHPVLFLALMCLTLLSKFGLLSKGPPAIWAIQCLAVMSLTRAVTLSPQKLVVLLFGTSIAFVSMMWIVNPDRPLGEVIEDTLVYRTLMVPNEGLIEYFSAIPQVIDFAWGRQLSWIFSFFSSTPTLPTYWLVGEVHRGVLASTTTVMFVGDAWADFAWFGVLTFPVALGFLSRTIDIYVLTRARKTIWSVAGIVLAHYGIYVAMNTALPTALLTGGLLFIIPLVFWFQRRTILSWPAPA